MFVDHQAYKERCSEPRKGPCFELIGTKMSGSVVEPWLEPVNMTEHVIVADDSASGKQSIPDHDEPVSSAIPADAYQVRI